MGRQRNLMVEMTWPEYKARIEGGAVVFLPVGSTEQHGHHMALGVDCYLPTAVASSVAELIDGVVAPPVTYGYKSQPRSGGGNHYIGTTSVGAASLIGYVRDILSEFLRHGARKIVVMNGHMENTWFLVEAVDLALADARRDGITDATVVKMDYYEFTTEETIKVVFPHGFPGWALEHAAVFETSLMMHYHPDLVHVDRMLVEEPASFPPYDVYPTDLKPIPPSGALSQPQSASPEKGRLLAEEYQREIAAALKTLFGM